MHSIPTKFFVTSGKASSKVSDLNAFDRALLNARIGEQNLVSMSSVLPVGIEEVETRDLPRGAITHCILAQQRGDEGEMLSAGIAYSFRKDGEGGYVSEGHIHGTRAALKEILEWKINEMARLRKVELKRVKFKIEELSVPMDHYGACVAALIYLE